MKRLRRWIFNLAVGVSLILAMVCAANWLRHDRWGAQLGAEIRLGIRSLSSQEMLLPGNSIPQWDWGLWGIEVRKETRFLWTDPPQPPQPNQIVGDHGWVRTGNGVPVVAFTVPYWLLVPITMILPVVWTMGYRARRRAQDRLARGQCVACGYDLCATPDRCPECGAVPEAAKGAAT